MDGSSGPLIVAMKGHPGTGKTTLARALAAALRCPLLDKDDVRDCTMLLQQHLQSTTPTILNSPTSAAGMLNELSYSVLWRLAETQLLRVGLGAVVVDSPLSDRRHLDRLLAIAERAGGRVVVVECRSGDEGEWRRRLEDRGREAAGAAVVGGNGGGDLEGWHKPATWEKLRRLVDGYGGRADYDMGIVPRLVIDTTAADGGGVEGAVERVIEFVGLSTQC